MDCRIVIFSEDAEKIAVYYREGPIKFFSLSKREQIFEISHNAISKHNYIMCNETGGISRVTMSKDQQYLCMTLWEQGYIYDLKTMDEVLTYEVDCTIMNLLNNHYSKCSKL